MPEKALKIGTAKTDVPFGFSGALMNVIIYLNSGGVMKILIEYCSV